MASTLHPSSLGELQALEWASQDQRENMDEESRSCRTIFVYYLSYKYHIAKIVY